MEDNSLVSEITDSNFNIRVNDEKNAVGRTFKKMFIYSFLFSSSFTLYLESMDNI